MKLLRVLSVFLISLTVAPAMAGVTPGAAVPERDTPSVLAMRVLVNRCLPTIVHERPVMTTGFFKVGDAVAKKVLQGSRGTVWTDRTNRLLMVSYADVPVCKVIALRVEPAVLGDLVLSVFREDDTAFRQQRFRIDEDGGFAALYKFGDSADATLVRVWTSVATTGERFATLTVERALKISN